MQILLVEDDASFASVVAEEVQSFAALRTAGSRDEAFDLLEAGFWDYVIIDLTLPTQDGAGDLDMRHGEAVLGRAQEVAPGTPVLILTGSPALNHVGTYFDQSEKVDVWGSQSKLQTIQFLTKEQLVALRPRLAAYAKAILSVSEIELVRPDIDLNEKEQQVVRIFVRRHDGRICDMSELAGGLSGARVFRLRVKDSSGKQLTDAVGKLLPIAEVVDEHDRYNKYVVPRLPKEATPRQINPIKYGGKDTAGIFYTFEGRYSESLFQILEAGLSGDKTVVKLRDFMTSWHTDVASLKEIGEIRRRILSDTDLSNIQKRFTVPAFLLQSKERVNTRWGCVHGDLHGANVLVRPDDLMPIIIDFADVGDGPRSLDPITLELSVLFHPQGRQMVTTWPSAAQAVRWHQMSDYLADCPFPEFVKECRRWAENSGAGQRERAVTAASYLTRQLKYPGMNTDLILGLLKSVESLWKQT